MSRARLDAVIVGAGLMGRWHAHAIRQCGGAVVGIVDTDTARAKTLATACGGVAVFGELQRALDAVSPAVVHVCIPLHTHVAMIRAALDRDCHVIAEKPLTRTAAEAEVLCAFAESRHRQLHVVHQFPYQQGVVELLARREELGALVHLEVNMASAGASHAVGTADTVVADILPHCLSLTRQFIAAPIQLLPWQVARVRDGEWRVTAQHDVVSVAFLLSMSARPPFAEMRLLGDRASAFVDLFHGYSVIDHGSVSRAAKTARPFRVAGRSMMAAATNLARRSLRAEPAYPGLNAFVREAYRAIGAETASPARSEEIIDVARARDRLIALSGWSATS